MSKSTNVVWHQTNVSSEQRAQQKQQKPVVLWFTGLSGSGKSTVANAAEALLFERGCHSYLLDGDNVRHGLNGDLGFSDSDRIENIRRVAEVGKLFVDSGLIVLTAFISPFRSERAMVKQLIPEGQFLEVFIDTPIEVCEQRDPKGLYQRARAGEIKNFTGIDSAYEAPIEPDIHIKTDELSIEACGQAVVNELVRLGFVV